MKYSCFDSCSRSPGGRRGRFLLVTATLAAVTLLGACSLAPPERAPALPLASGWKSAAPAGWVAHQRVTASRSPVACAAQAARSASGSSATTRSA